MAERTGLRRAVGSVLLAVFGLAELVIGLWAVAFPKSFYDRFPGFGWHWVRAAGPYDEHLLRDFGGALAGLAVVALLCAAQPARALVLAMVAGWEIEAVPHFAYHALHKDLPTGQDAVNLTVLALVVVAPLVAGFLLWPRRGTPSQPAPAAAPGTGSTALERRLRA